MQNLGSARKASVICNGDKVAKVAEIHKSILIRYGIELNYILDVRSLNAHPLVNELRRISWFSLLDITLQNG